MSNLPNEKFEATEQYVTRYDPPALTLVGDYAALIDRGRSSSSEMYHTQQAKKALWEYVLVVLPSMKRS